MLTMSCVYFNIWQIKQTEPGDFAKGLIGFGKDVEKNLLEATSPFVFSTVNERTILRVVDEIQTHSRPVIEHCYREFLIRSADPEEREYPDPERVSLAYSRDSKWRNSIAVRMSLQIERGTMRIAPPHRQPRRDAQEGVR